MSFAAFNPMPALRAVARWARARAAGAARVCAAVGRAIVLARTALILLLGAICMSAGAAAIFRPAGLILFGALMIAAALPGREGGER